MLIIRIRIGYRVGSGWDECCGSGVTRGNRSKLWIECEKKMQEEIAQLWTTTKKFCTFIG